MRLQPTLSVSSARLLFSKSAVLAQLNLWRTHLPTVQPHYAVKANNDPQLLRWLAASGVQFDCASIREMHDVAAAGGKGIIYAQPCKTVADIKKAAALKVPLTVVDSPEEVDKLREAQWPGNVLIRLLVPDKGSAQPFSRKFGAPIEWVPDIQCALAKANIPHVGWSFHVGSMCSAPAQFATAIQLAATASTTAASRQIVDLGGGFLHDAPSFAAAAAAIKTAMPLFPPTTRWIAEPGRFFAAPAAEAEIEVIGVKSRLPGTPAGLRVTVDESVYGIFSNIPFDGQVPAFHHIDPQARHRPPTHTTLFGRTCDSADCLAEDILLPELRVGDRLRIPTMGAYTIVSASEFNGFPQAQRVYLDDVATSAKNIRLQ
jgi:ornithine decarboxylase